MRSIVISAVAVATLALAAAPASAASLFKGIGVVQSTSGLNPQCSELFGVGDDFVVHYRPGSTLAKESMLIQHADGAVTIVDADTTGDATLRTGKATLSGFVFGFTRTATQTISMTISPKPVTATTATVTVTVTIPNVLPLCNVRLRAVLLAVDSPL